MKDQSGTWIPTAVLELDSPDVQMKMTKVNISRAVDQVRYVNGNAKASQTCRYSYIDCSPSP